jgi:hypothetical protein
MRSRKVGEIDARPSRTRCRKCDVRSAMTALVGRTADELAERDSTPTPCVRGHGLTSISKLLNAEGAPSPRAQQGRPNGWCACPSARFFDGRGIADWSSAVRQRNATSGARQSNGPTGFRTAIGRSCRTTHCVRRRMAGGARSDGGPFQTLRSEGRTEGTATRKRGEVSPCWSVDVWCLRGRNGSAKPEARQSARRALRVLSFPAEGL